MSQSSVHLTGVCATALIPIFYRALENHRPDPIVRDPLAAELIKRIDYDFSRFNTDAPDPVFALMRTRHFDRFVCSFLAQFPDGIVVDIGCGLDTRFERLDNGIMQWYGIDLPLVIELRRGLLHETERSHFLAYSGFDCAWMDHIHANLPRALLLLAEGVFPYLREEQVKMLVGALAVQFPCSELMFDAMSPLFVRLHNHRRLLKHLDLRLEWGLSNPRDLQTWSDRIRLTSRWGYFEEPEPRLGRYRWLRFAPCLRSANWVARYRLG